MVVYPAVKVVWAPTATTTVAPAVTVVVRDVYKLSAAALAHPPSPMPESPVPQLLMPEFDVPLLLMPLLLQPVLP